MFSVKMLMSIVPLTLTHVLKGRTKNTPYTQRKGHQARPRWLPYFKVQTFCSDIIHLTMISSILVEKSRIIQRYLEESSRMFSRYRFIRHLYNVQNHQRQQHHKLDNYMMTYQCISFLVDFLLCVEFGCLPCACMWPVWGSPASPYSPKTCLE